ncbi:OmpA family protein [Cellulophaga fucicola]|uniref:WD40-like Beta Propeller Repeat n=1 Tax=Cellulophaga fucicola TaxID=76595 RepID=A0A1K1Q9I4_9FLAO|nr:OmpA family protein [Cellulophaga fucicola]SFW56369.1 WD40-like Beta Propeller Repeat [Cellulophaga fucicola]
MKKIVPTCLLLFSLSIFSQEVKKETTTTQNSPTKEAEYPVMDLNNYSFTDDAETNDIIKKSKSSGNNNKLIERANAYFDMLWYAEAAELYDEALNKDKENYTQEILQKAGDSHYYNTNMEMAYHWYKILYDTYKDDLSADQIFKYSHALKGNGKYGKAKRFMRLYNRMKKDAPLESGLTLETSERNEQVLDGILSRKPNSELKNLSVNTENSDFSPMFYNKEEIVFASAKDSSFFSTRKYKWNNQPYLDLYVAKINQQSDDLKDAIKFSKKVNTKYHEASVTFSPDNKTMYFTRNNYGKKLRRDKNGVNNLKLYMSKKIDGEWTEAVELPFNSDEYSTGHPALSPDGKQLYFVSDMPGSIGETDIFVVDVLEDGLFSSPKNLGPKINTEQKEMFPFINGKKLYFSSNGHVGLGGLDVYEVAYDEDGFKDVVNVGQPINSNKDDFSYIINEETQKGYFASNRQGGKGDDDIYSFKNLMVEEVNKNAIAGVVTEIVTGELMPKALITLLDENNIKLKEVLTEDDGSFVFEDLDSNTKYKIQTNKETYFGEELATTTKENEVVNVGIAMRKLHEMIAIENGIKKLKTEKIFFNFDKSYIRQDAGEELDKLVSVMNEYPEMRIKIESHTDARGNNAYNKYLSDKRAKSTEKYIISKGIDPSRIISAIGYGEEQLINECADGVSCTRKEHQENRRSEFIIVDM